MSDADIIDLMPKDWDEGPYGVALAIKAVADAFVDHGTSKDTGYGNGFADLWLTLGGREYIIQIKPVGKPT